MKQVFAAHGEIVVLDVPEPSPRPSEVLVATSFSVISSGAEASLLRSTVDQGEMRPEFRAPNIPQVRNTSRRWSPPPDRTFPPGVALQGYSLSGTVLAVGQEVTDLSPGDRVACGGLQCAFHAERVAIPRNLVAPVPPGVSTEDSAFTTVGTIALNALRQSGCQVGESVVVYGLGLLGLLAVQIARTAGMHVIGIDIDARRVAAARDLGAHVVLNSQVEGDVIARVIEATGGFGADAVLLFVSTSSNEPLNTAFDIIRQRGCVVGVGEFGMDIVRSKWFGHDVKFVPSVAYGPGRYDPVYEEGNVDYPIGYVRWPENRNMEAILRFLAEGSLKVDSLAPIRIPMRDAPEAYRLLQSPERPPTVLLTYEQN